MPRYIDADELLKRIYPMGIGDGMYTINAKAVKFAIDNAPTADVVPRAELAVKSFQDVATIYNLQEKIKKTNGCSKKLCPMQVGAADNCTLAKEQCPYFTQDIDYQKALRAIKVLVAREIFEELETVFCHSVYPRVNANGTITTVRLHHWHIRPDDYNAIKKKYTE